MLRLQAEAAVPDNLPGIKLQPRLRGAHLQRAPARRVEHASRKRRDRRVQAVEAEGVVVPAGPLQLFVFGVKTKADGVDS